MSRLPLADPETLDPYLQQLHDDAREDDWPTRHTARAFAPAPELLRDYLVGFYYPGTPARHPPRAYQRD